MSPRPRAAQLGLTLLLGGALCGLLWANLHPPLAPTRYRLGGYVTSLQGRRLAQRRNAIQAARALDGVVIRPGKTFSYNAHVVLSDEAPGYERAPVSLGGALVPALGGGVCQTSSTLYNAALLAGLTVLERHPHAVAPRYCPAGLDAAVAWPGVDLRLKNPYPFPVSLRTQVEGSQLRIELLGPRPLPTAIHLETQVVSVRAPRTRVVPQGRAARGTPGLQVVAFRVRQGVRERLSEDSYATVDTVAPR